MREVRKRGAFRGRCGLREPSTLRAAGRELGQGVPAGLSPPPSAPTRPGGTLTRAQKRGRRGETPASRLLPKRAPGRDQAPRVLSLWA